MKRQRVIVCAALLLAWSALAAWQWREYGHECRLARDTLRRQAGSVMNALVGGIRSHRRLGRFFQDQLQGSLDELVRAKDILAVAIVAEDGKTILQAGKTELLDGPASMSAGESWEAAAFRSVVGFRLDPDTGGGPPGGPGWGRGRGRGWRGQLEGRDDGPFFTGGQFAAILLLDRTQTDLHNRRSARLRIAVVAAGGLVLMCVALAWRATVRLVEARGRARVLETEARHLRELSQAAAGLAHETRNPLGLIRGWTQRLAQSSLDSSQQRQHARMIVEECDRVTSRINQFLAFARPCQPAPGLLDFDELLDELAALLEPDLEAKSLKLGRVVPEPFGSVRADREMLRQALFNLLQNAVQFAPEAGTVEIAVRLSQDGRYRVEVSDRGPGVKADNVESLFAPYFTTRSDGTGLGLAIVRQIATAHGWEVGYTPRPGGGSVFWLDRIDG